MGAVRYHLAGATGKLRGPNKQADSAHVRSQVPRPWLFRHADAVASDLGGRSMSAGR